MKLDSFLKIRISSSDVDRLESESVRFEGCFSEYIRHKLGCNGAIDEKPSKLDVAKMVERQNLKKNSGDR